MIVMVGECTGKNVPLIQSLGWGRMWVARGRHIYTYEGEPWGFDNGAYRDYTAGRRFDEDAFERSLGRAVAAGTPYLAVTPDIVRGGLSSRDFSYEWRERLPDHFPWYFAVQDGMTPADVDLTRFAGVFLGGGDRYKATAGEWRDFAHGHGKRFHYGRCGTPGKLEHAFIVGADSVDSAGFMWEQHRWRDFIHHYSDRPQLLLPFITPKHPATT